GETIAAWESAQTAINQSAALLGVSIEDLLATPRPGQDVLRLQVQSPTLRIEQLTETLVEVKRAVKDRDWSGLADVLEYEMPDLCTAWQQLLTAAAHVLALDPDSRPAE
ncbi:MAG: hypothetical protein H7210_11610, partial [Pyrinomonadaceae bacterium]|nr:hypothetical protein [Phycisphaerales bacterium]